MVAPIVNTHLKAKLQIHNISLPKTEARMAVSEIIHTARH